MPTDAWLDTTPSDLFAPYRGKGAVDLSRLDIQDGTIHYLIYAQDGTLTPMTCADTPDLRHFVDYVQRHDRYTTDHEEVAPCSERSPARGPL